MIRVHLVKISGEKVTVQGNFSIFFIKNRFMQFMRIFLVFTLHTPKVTVLIKKQKETQEQNLSHHLGYFGTIKAWSTVDNKVLVNILFYGSGTIVMIVS